MSSKNPAVKLCLQKKWTFRAADSEMTKGWTHVDDLTLFCFWSSSIHSLTPEAWLVCCRGLRLLLSTMSEHMQLSLALCRIGFYTVRKHMLLSVVWRTAGMCCVLGACVCARVCVCWIDFCHFHCGLIFPWRVLVPSVRVSAAPTSLLLGHWMERVLCFILVGVHMILRWNRWMCVLWAGNETCREQAVLSTYSFFQNRWMERLSFFCSP